MARREGVWHIGKLCPRSGTVRDGTVRHIPYHTISYGLGIHTPVLQAPRRALQRESGRPEKENHRDRNNQVIVFISMKRSFGIVLTLRTAGEAGSGHSRDGNSES